MFAVASRGANPPVPPGTVTGDVAGNLILASADATAARESRPVYRHSVIPGGVYRFGELVEATENDPVVLAQYGSAVRTPFRIAASPGPRRVYMSYRMGDRVYWTRKKVPLNAGEMTLTNGDIEIRARCGNQISEIEMFPVADSEPDSAEFDSLIADEPDLLASGAAAFPPFGIGSVPGALQTVTPPAVPGMVPTTPIGVPGWDGGVLYPLGVPGTSPGSTPVGVLPPIVVPPGNPGVPLPFPVDTPPLAIGGPPDGERPEWLTPPVDPPGTPFVPDPFVPTPDDEGPTLTPVPEPGTFVLLGSALAGLLAMRHRRRARKGEKPSPPE
jgi:hypothetical protein